jgi:hypothetical protein
VRETVLKFAGLFVTEGQAGLVNVIPFGKAAQ